MITNDVISAIYKKYDKRPKSLDCLDFALLFEKVGILHDILVDTEDDCMTIGSVPEDSPFHSIKLGNMHAIIAFEEWVAIVMHSSMLFLNCKKPVTSIHIKEPEMSIWDKIFG